MCEDLAEHTTVIGPRREMELLLGEYWFRLRTAERYGLEPPDMLDLAHLRPGGESFERDDSPAIAVVRHRLGVGFSLAAELQVELLVGDGIPPLAELLVEPGYAFVGAQGGTAPTVSWTKKLTQAVQSAPKVSAADRARGHKVALLDTGLLGGQNNMADFTGTTAATVTADDPHGHGSAVADLITAVNPSADIFPVRVLDQYRRGESYEILGGLAYSLWSGMFDVVNASLETATSGSCETSLGRSLNYLLSMCRAHSGHRLPVLVAAAGNDPNAPSRYPAILPGAVVAVALDASGNRASFNTPPRGGATVQEAFGGTQTDPLGDITRPGEPQEDLWGTSFAAGIVTGAYLP